MTRQTLHWLIAIEICLILVSYKLYWSGLSYAGIDQPLLDWIFAQGEKDLTTQEIILGLLGFSSIPILIFSWIWLWSLRPYSRIIYVITSIPGFVLLPLTGPHVSNGWPDIFEGLASIVAGMIIGALYFSDLYPHKTKK
jgi:hypothetical protein